MPLPTTSSSSIEPNTAVKWGYAVANVPDLPATWCAARTRVAHAAPPPRPQDIVVARVVEIGQHTRIDLRDGSKSVLFEGDLLGLVLSARYATRRFGARVPETLDELHFVCSGGVGGRVDSVPPDLKQPTVVEALGYLTDERGDRVNLRDHRPAANGKLARHVPVVVVAGSSMDSGKTTTAASLINGLSRGGQRVAAAKVTGTASTRDVLLMRDAGAVRALDFTAAGFGSTAGLGADELTGVLDSLLSQLAAEQPDAVVLELADGIVQDETAALLDHVARHELAHALVYTCADALGVRRGVEHLQRRGLPVAAVSGTVTASALGVAEAERETALPVFTREQLRLPGVAGRIIARDEEEPRAHAAG